MVFARNPAAREFARELGAAWLGDIDESPLEPLHATIDATPAWKPVLAAMAHLSHFHPRAALPSVGESPLFASRAAAGKGRGGDSTLAKRVEKLRGKE